MSYQEHFYISLNAGYSKVGLVGNMSQQQNVNDKIVITVCIH